MAEDKSGFKGKPYVNREEFRTWLKGDEDWEITRLPGEQRENLGKHLLKEEKFGQLIEKGEPEAAIRGLESGEIPPPPGITKERAIDLLKKFLGK